MLFQQTRVLKTSACCYAVLSTCLFCSFIFWRVLLNRAGKFPEPCYTGVPEAVTHHHASRARSRVFKNQRGGWCCLADVAERRGKRHDLDRFAAGPRTPALLCSHAPIQVSSVWFHLTCSGITLHTYSIVFLLHITHQLYWQTSEWIHVYSLHRIDQRINAGTFATLGPRTSLLWTKDWSHGWDTRWNLEKMLPSS